MQYDVIIIGAGPGGIFSAYELSKPCPEKRIAVFEEGQPLEKRRCPIDGKNVRHCIGCPTCAIMNGFGGAGAFSDGKYNLTNDFGGTLYEYIGKKQAMELMHYVDDQARSVFIGERIFNETELASRLEVELEKFTMKVQIESRVLGDLAINHIVPTAVSYQNRLLENLRGLRETFSPEEYEELSADRKELIREISRRVTAIKMQVRQMTEARKVANHMDNYKDKAFAYEETVRPYLESIRDHIDHLEMEVDDEIWPLPKYRELLFTK